MESIVASENLFSLENVKIDKQTLRPGEEINISFRLTEDAKTTIRLYSPDYDVVRTLMDRQKRPAGTNNAVWDGRDDAGNLVPDEAYLVNITAEGPSGKKVTYDPTNHSGGEILDIQIDRIEELKGKYNIHYSIPSPSRINIRAGIHNGPLLKTVVDWRPFPAGDYVQPWDGLDETRQIQVLEELGHVIYIRGFLLPENSIIVEGSSGDYQKYQRNVQPRVLPGQNSLSYQSVREEALMRDRERISPDYLVRRRFNVSPKFTVFHGSEESVDLPLAERPITNVSGDFGFTLEVAAESIDNFNESRYEIVVFADNQRFDEEEQAYTPYTYTLDTTRLSNGEHDIAINLSSITGQVGCYCFRIKVEN
ncbi:MAG: hypothetical protein SCALA701_36880 [Candidatus Scalindua sp.]|nr:MAG: hypothetical protein SCALA701_36880 [Candidatus Scalindua sp.]